MRCCCACVQMGFVIVVALLLCISLVDAGAATTGPFFLLLPIIVI